MKYSVTIRAIITKTIVVEANDEEEADQLAHEEFNPNDSTFEESYDQETVSTIPLNEIHI